MWNWHSLTEGTQNNLSRSPAQLCQTTSCTAAVWNQSRCPSDSLQAAAVRGTVWLHGLGMKSVYRRTTIQLAERSGYFMHQLITRSDTSIPAVCYACRLWCPLPCHKWVLLNWYLSTMGWRWTASTTETSCCLSRQMLPAIKRVAERCLFAKRYVAYGEIGHFFVFCDFPR